MGYVTLANFSLEKGVTLATKWELLPPPKPVDLKKLASSKGQGDSTWTPVSPRMKERLRSGFTRAAHQLEMYFPREPGRKGSEDVWMRLASGEGFTNVSLAFAVDAMPYVVEAWKPREDETEEVGPEDSVLDRDENYWYPTLALNLDIKKALPEQGTEWLFLRTMTRSVRNGRLDLQATVLDADGSLVAIASQVNLVLSSARNTAKRSGSKEKL